MNSRTALVATAFLALLAAASRLGRQKPAPLSADQTPVEMGRLVYQWMWVASPELLLLPPAAPNQAGGPATDEGRRLRPEVIAAIRRGATVVVGPDT